MARPSTELPRLWRMTLVITLLLQLHLSNAFFNNASFPGARLPPSMRPKVRVTQNFHDCAAHQDTIERSYVDAHAMIRPALQRVETLRIFLQRDPTADTEISGIDRSTLYTFETFFGKLYRAPATSHPEGFERLDILKDRLNRLDIHYTSHRLEIWCSENFLTKLPQHLIPPDKGDEYLSKLYFDNRPADLGGQDRLYTPIRCGGENKVKAMTYSYGVFKSPSGSYDLVVLCPWYFGEWFSDPPVLLHFPMGELRTHRFEDRSMHLDRFAHESLAVTLIHELSHSLRLFPYPHRATRDTGGYGFKQITKTADQYPEDAIYNADNTAYFVLAMYLNLFDWSTGFNTPMFADAPFGTSP
ncbi:hypothetical protein FQN49_006256 [Arthroderma sp. PD_2]|nr:hypothetical protein FQN49_006256 [Arthroderma sp. PD_2]